MYGAWLGGISLGAVGMGIHHRLCHVLGGSFGLPHAGVHSVILPYAAAFNREAAPDAMRMIADALGRRDAAEGLHDLAIRLGAPTSLAAIGMPRDDLGRAAILAAENPPHNPRPVDAGSVRALLEEAYRGEGP